MKLTTQQKLDLRFFILQTQRGEPVDGDLLDEVRTMPCRGILAIRRNRAVALWWHRRQMQDRPGFKLEPKEID